MKKKGIRLNDIQIKVIIIGTMVIVCLVVIMIGLLLQEPGKNNDEETVMVHDYHYSYGNNDIDRKIAEIYDEKRYSTGRPDIEIGKDCWIGNGQNDMPHYFVYNDIGYYQGDAYVEDEYVGEKLGVEEEYGLSVHKINDITDKFSIAVKEEATGKYWSYSMYYEEVEYYRPETMEEFFEVSGFFKYIKNLEITLYDVKGQSSVITYYDNSDSFMNYFVEEITKISAEDKKEGTRVEGVKKSGLSISCILDHVEEAVEIQFYENGDIVLSCGAMVGYMTFNIGEHGIEFATNLLEYLDQNAKGYIEYFPGH